MYTLYLICDIIYNRKYKTKREEDFKFSSFCVGGNYKLITKEIGRKFLKVSLYSQDGKGGNSEVIVKFFNPFGAGTLYITEGNKL